MIIINPNNSVFIFSMIPKSYNSAGVYTMVLIDDQKNTNLGTFIATTIQSDKDITNLTFTILNKFYEGGFFDAEFLLNGVTVFKSRIFATTQNINSYSINSGKFTLPNISNNDYITI